MAQETDSIETRVARVARSAPSACILGGAIVFAALLYFAVNLHRGVPGGRGMAFIYNTVTGSTILCESGYGCH